MSAGSWWGGAWVLSLSPQMGRADPGARAAGKRGAPSAQSRVAAHCAEGGARSGGRQTSQCCDVPLVPVEISSYSGQHRHNVIWGRNIEKCSSLQGTGLGHLWPRSTGSSPQSRPEPLWAPGSRHPVTRVTVGWGWEVTDLEQVASLPQASVSPVLRVQWPPPVGCLGPVKACCWPEAHLQEDPVPHSEAPLPSRLKVLAGPPNPSGPLRSGARVDEPPHAHPPPELATSTRTSREHCSPA